MLKSSIKSSSMETSGTAAGGDLKHTQEMEGSYKDPDWRPAKKTQMQMTAKEQHSERHKKTQVVMR